LKKRGYFNLKTRSLLKRESQGLRTFRRSKNGKGGGRLASYQEGSQFLWGAPVEAGGEVTKPTTVGEGRGELENQPTITGLQ